MIQSTELIPAQYLPELSADEETEINQAEALLTENDLTWLNQLSTDEVDESDLTGINELILADVPRLQYITDAQEANARDARTLFYEDVLGWGNQQSPYHSSYERMKEAFKTSSSGLKSGRPLGAFIPAARKIVELNLDIERVAKSAPALLNYSADALQENYDAINELGFSTEELIHLAPAVLVTRSPESLKTHYNDLSAYFEARGIDVRKIIERAPFVLGFTVEAIDQKMRDMTNLGLDANWLIKTKPTLISQSSDSVRERFLFLAEQGLNATKLIGRAPSVLEYSDERIKASVNFMKSVGLDVPKVTFSAPTMLCLSTENLQKKLDNLSELGLDPVAAINRSATIATYSAETIKSKMAFIENLLRGLDAPVEVASLIQHNPDLLSRDVNGMYIAARFALVEGTPLDTPQAINSAFTKSVDETVLRAIKSQGTAEIKLPKKKSEYHAVVMEQLMQPGIRANLGKLSLNTLANHENARGVKFLEDIESRGLQENMTSAGDSITTLPIVAPARFDKHKMS